MLVLKNCLLVSLFLGQASFLHAQEMPTVTQTANITTLNCQVLNPEDLSNSTQFSNLSIKARKSVVIGINENEGKIAASVQLSAGSFSLKPRDPIIFSTKIKASLDKVESIVLNNVDEEETDSIVLSPSLTEGTIFAYGAELQITCELPEQN